MKHILIQLGFVLLSINSFAQPVNVDSLLNVYKQHPNDSNGLIALSKATLHYFNANDYQNTIKYGEKTLPLALGLKNNLITARMYEAMANSLDKLGRKDESANYTYKALRYYELAGNKPVLAHMYQGIGVGKFLIGNLDGALDDYRKSYELHTQVKDTHGIITSGVNIGLALIQCGKNDSALAFINTSIKLCKIAYDSSNWIFPFTYNAAGNAYLGIGYSCLEKGNQKLADENFNTALNYYLLAVAGWKRSSNPKGEFEAKENVANALINLRRYDDARKYLLEAIDGVRKNEPVNYRILNGSYLNLSNLESNCGNYKKALEYYQQYVAYRDSVSNNELKERDIQSQMQYEFDKKEADTKAEQEKKDALSAAAIQKQKTTFRFTIAGVIILLCFAGYVFYNFQRKKKFEKQQALSSERLRISRELHDDIGSTLGSIAVFSDVAKRRSSKDIVSEEALSKIGKASRELIEKMGDIIWNLNPENENFEQLQNRMQAFASMILTPREINVEFNFDDNLKSVVLGAEQRKNLFLIFKESVHNIVKHAEAKNVFISMQKENDTLDISIKDDGKGFEMNDVQSMNLKSLGGNGLKSMTERANAIVASFKIWSKVNEGTTIELSIKV